MPACVLPRDKKESHVTLLDVKKSSNQTSGVLFLFSWHSPRVPAASECGIKKKDNPSNYLERHISVSFGNYRVKKKYYCRASRGFVCEGKSVVKHGD